MRVSACLLPLVLCVVACTPYPRDPDRTLERVRGGVLLAGVSPDPPYVVLPADGPPQGSDVDRLQAVARAVGARIEWVPGDHDGLMHDLHGRRLHAVVGGIAVDSPWKAQVALTRPFDARDAQGRQVHRVIALPPGENAWVMHVESVVHPVRP